MYKSQMWFGFHKLPQILCYLNKNSWPSCPSSSLPAVNSAPLLPHQAASLKACPGHPCPWDQPTNTREYPHQFHTLIHQSVHRHFTRHSQKELLQYRPLPQKVAQVCLISGSSSSSDILKYYEYCFSWNLKKVNVFHNSHYSLWNRHKPEDTWTNEVVSEIPWRCHPSLVYSLPREL